MDIIAIRVQLRLLIQLPYFSEEEIKVEHGCILGWKPWDRVVETLYWAKPPLDCDGVGTEILGVSVEARVCI